jgi:hypothetical protein
MQNVFIALLRTYSIVCDPSKLSYKNDKINFLKLFLASENFQFSASFKAKSHRLPLTIFFQSILGMESFLLARTIFSQKEK